MIVDGIASSQHLDSSGEILDISGHDISDLEEGRGLINFEHDSSSPDNILGQVIFAKKIMKRAECSNDRERMFWDSCGTPLVYIKAELYDKEGHAGATAMAASLRYYHNRGIKVAVGFSIEGSTLDRQDNLLKRSVGRRVAMTYRPCNKSAISMVYEDTQDKSIKKYMESSATSKIKTYEVDNCIFEDDMIKSELSPLEALKQSIYALEKTLTAGSYNVAPSQLTGGSALQVEDRSMKAKGLSQETKNKLKSTFKNWDRKRPLKEVIKAAMPEVSDEYVDHFVDVAKEISLKKGEKPAVRIGPHHSWNANQSDKQRRLIDGLYVDGNQPFTGHLKNGMETSNKMSLHRNDAGADVIIKHPTQYEGTGHDPAVAASAYHKVADGFFGLGDHVPVTNHFSHSSVGKPGENTQAQEFIKDAHTPFDASWGKTLKSARDDGSAHKLAIADMIMGGDTDRHAHNMLGKNGKLINIDNDDAFKYDSKTSWAPDHFNDFDDNMGGRQPGIGKDMMHIDAVQWLSKLDPKAMVISLMDAGVPKAKIPEAVRRLKVLQAGAPGKTMNDIHNLINGKPFGGE